MRFKLCLLKDDDTVLNEWELGTDPSDEEIDILAPMRGLQLSRFASKLNREIELEVERSIYWACQKDNQKP